MTDRTGRAGPGPARRRPRVVAAVAALALAVPACAPDAPRPLPIADIIVNQEYGLPDGEPDEGRRLALMHCQQCHIFPEPALLSRDVWQLHILPRMGARLGMHNVDESCISGVFDGAPGEEAAIIVASGLYPDTPQVPPESWERIKAWYLEKAPESLTPEGVRGLVPRGLRGFRAVAWPLARQPPATTLLHIDEEGHRLLLGDSALRTLTTLAPDGRVLEDVSLGIIPVWMNERDGVIRVLGLGSVVPSDVPLGQLLELRRSSHPTALWEGGAVLDQLQRPAGASFADLTRDGREDVVVCEFGNQLGRLTWYEALPERGYRQHVLAVRPGAMVTHTADMNGDGAIDIVVLFAQGREGVSIFYNEGDGRFTESYVVQTPPSHGSTWVELIDDDDDGRPDLLVTTGDNGDYPAILKPYHGIRIYRNDGRNRFREVFFHPLNGAYKALMRDFDEDGHADIAAIAMFPDLVGDPGEGFVLLRGLGDLRFDVATFPEVESGRWISMDAGDLDGDGDVDIVLGSYTDMPGAVPPRLVKAWAARGLPVLFLRNTLR